MIDLFNEYHNQLVGILYALLKNSQEGTIYKEIDIDKRLPIHTKLLHLEDALKTIFFKNTPAGMAARFSLHLPDASPSIAEKQWLKTLLEDKKFTFILSQELRQKLESYLQDIAPLLPIFAAEDIRPQGDVSDKEPLCTILTIFQQSLVQDQQINLTLRTCPDEPFNCIPFRLEYDAAAKRFSFWITPTDDTVFRRIPATEVSGITLLSSKAPDQTAAFENFLKKHEQEVLLKVRPKYNNVVRCFLLFASYQKESTYHEQTDEYRLKVHYYDFDEPDVLQNIISLGSAVIVLSPAPLRDKVIYRLKASWDAYQ